MRVLAMASQKGGSGKTTMSGHLAVQAQRAGAGPVCLIDIDPQGSLADWWNEREDEMPAFAQTTVARLASDLEVLRQQGVSAELFAEERQLAEAQFRFRMPSEPMHEVMRLRIQVVRGVQEFTRHWTKART